MVGNDVINQMHAHLSTRLCSFKWFLAVFFFLLDNCLINAWTIWQLCMLFEVRQSGYDSQKWMCDVWMQLLADAHGVHWMEWKMSVAPVITPCKGNWGKQTGGGYSSAVDLSAALLSAIGGKESKKGKADMSWLMPTTSHFISHKDSPKYCKLCYDTFNKKVANVRTCWEKCGYGVHLDCFQAWHTNINAVSKHVFCDVPPAKQQKK
jgi:hypothetical protein